MVTIKLDWLPFQIKSIARVREYYKLQKHNSSRLYNMEVGLTKAKQDYQTR